MLLALQDLLFLNNLDFTLLIEVSERSSEHLDLFFHIFLNANYISVSADFLNLMFASFHQAFHSLVLISSLHLLYIKQN
jgi:hypothetical protein